jgi:AraC-like DNA-binding protein
MPYSTIHLSALVDAVRRAGADVSGRVAPGSPSVDAAHCFGGFDAAQFERLLELCLAESHNPALGLAMGEQASLVSLGLSAGTSSRAASLRVAIETFNARYAVSVDEQSPELSVVGGEAVLTFPVHGASAGTARLRAEYGVTLGVLLLRVWAGPFTTPHWVSFPHEAPSYAEAYRRLFGIMVRFGAERAAIGFSAELLRAQAYSWGRQLPPSFPRRVADAVDAERVTERVREFLVSHTRTERPGMTEIADHLGMTERTLRRRLASEGVRFRELWNEARRTRALSLALDLTHSPETASEALRFSDVSAYYRAFKRWTGFTPGRYRAMHLRDRAGCGEERPSGIRIDGPVDRAVIPKAW